MMGVEFKVQYLKCPSQVYSFIDMDYNMASMYHWNLIIRLWVSSFCDDAAAGMILTLKYLSVIVQWLSLLR